MYLRGYRWGLAAFLRVSLCVFLFTGEGSNNYCLLYMVPQKKKKGIHYSAREQTAV